MLGQGNARDIVAFGKGPSRDYGSCRCIDLLDMTVGYDEEVVVGPDETSVE